MENRIIDGFTSLVSSSSSEEIAAQYDIDINSKHIDVFEHINISLRLDIADPNTLEDLAQQTDVYADRTDQQWSLLESDHAPTLPSGR